MVKNGNFYISLDNDALIMSNIFNYKIKESNNVIKVGFPISSIDIITMKLENLKLNYLIIGDGIIDKSNILDNKYDEFLGNVINNKIYIK